MSRRNDRGAAAVEFALIMPILLMLVFAIISFGYLFAQKESLGNAAWQTARYSVVENRTCAEIRAEAIDAAKPLDNLSNDDIHVKIQRGIEGSTPINRCPTGSPDVKPCEGSADKENIYVTLVLDTQMLVPVVPGMSKDQSLDGRGVFRCEWS